MASVRSTPAPRLSKSLLLVDVETTGLDPAHDEIIALAGVHLDADTLNEKASFSTLIRSTRQSTADAYSTHGLSVADLVDAPREKAALDRFIAFAPRDAIIAGHNVAFDVAFLKSAYGRHRREFPFDYHTLDVWSLAFFILGADGIRLPKYNLDYLCGLYGIPRQSTHDALADVRATAQVLRHLFASVAGRELGALGQLPLFG